MHTKARKKINPAVKTVLEMGPVVLFFVAYLWLRGQAFVIGNREYDAFVLLSAGFVPLFVLTTLTLWRLSGSLPKIQLLTLVLVVVFGGLTFWLNDERFFKMKPSMIYAIFGGLLGVGLLRRQSYLQFVLAEALPLQERGWMILTRRVMVFFFALAVLNEIIWRTQSTDMWVYFKTFGLTLATFIFFILQGPLYRQYAGRDPKAQGE